MTEIIFIVVKPKKKLKHTQNDPQSALIWRNAPERIKKQMGLFSWYVKTDPVVHRQIRKLFSKMFMYLLKTAKDFIYIRKKKHDKHIYSPFEAKKTRHQKCDQIDKSEEKRWFKRPNCHTSDRKKKINEIVNFSSKQESKTKAGFKNNVKSKTKSNIHETGKKTIVNSLRLLHETFLYFEIGSNQVANNDNNFCNKIKPRWENPHEFNNFATQEHFFSFFFLYLLRTYTSYTNV